MPDAEQNARGGEADSDSEMQLMSGLSATRRTALSVPIRVGPWAYYVLLVIGDCRPVTPPGGLPVAICQWPAS